MKFFYFILSGILLSSTAANAQQVDSLSKNADFEKLTAKLFSLKSTAPQAGLLVDFSKRPTIKGVLPLYRDAISAFFVDAGFSSNNDFVPLFERGKWATDAVGALSYTLFLSRDNSTFLASTKTEQQQRAWTWLNVRGGYNFSSYLLYRDDNSTDIEREISRRNYHNIFGQVNLGFYLSPFKNSLSWLNLSGNAGFEYRQNDNNYMALQTVRLKSYNKISSDASTQELEVTSEETSAKKGDFVVANSANLNYSLTLLINNGNGLAFGINFYGKTRLTEALKSTDLGFGINVPVRVTKNSERRTLANLSLNYEVTDVGGKLNPNRTNFSDKGLLGLTVAIPVYTLSSQ